MTGFSFSTSRLLHRPLGRALCYVLTYLLCLEPFLLNLQTELSHRVGPLAYAADVIDLTQLHNVDDRTTQTLSGFRYNRRTRTFFGNATITNSSGEALPTPMYLVLTAITPESVTLHNAEGDTLSGNRYFDLSPLIAGDALAPGASTNPLILELANPNRSQFEMDLSVFVAGTPNTAPVADAGPGQTVSPGETVTLDGSGSSDVDGNHLNFSWGFASTPAGSVAMLSDPHAVQPTFDVDLPGPYHLELIVDDGIVDSAPDTVVITTDNSPPMADAGPDQTVSVNDMVHLNGSASSDVNGDTLAFHWSLSTPPASTAVLSDPAAVSPAFVPDIPGTYVAMLVVDDGLVESAPDTVVVSTENVPPLADAGPDSTVLANDSILLDGNGSSDADSDPLTFAWSVIAAPWDSSAGLSDPAAVTPILDVDVPGTYVIQLIVNDGAVDSTPDTVVISTINSRPVAHAGENQTVSIDATVVVDGSGSYDADGDPIEFAWAFLAVPEGSTAALPDPAAESPSFTADLAGLYLIQLIVDDGTVKSAADTALIEVANMPPVAMDDAYTTDEDRLLAIPAPGVLANDTDDAHASTLSAFLVNDVTSGVLQFSSNGFFLFTPQKDFNGLAIFTYRANDGFLDSSGVGTVTITVNPVNDRPQIVSTPVTAATDKQLYTYEVEAVDPDENETLTFSLPQARQGMTIDAATGRIEWKPQTSQVGPNPVTVRVEDKAKRFDTQRFAIEVVTTNAVPIVAAGQDQTVAEGDTVSLAPAGFTDADSEDDHTATIDWGDDKMEAGVVTQSPGSGTVAGAHIYADDGAFTVTVCVTDDDGATGCDTLTVTVTNLAPTVDAGADQKANVGAVVNLDPSTFSDPGVQDIHTAVINWGDETIDPGSVAQNGGSGTVAGSHVYTVRGPFTTEVCVQDGGDATCDTLSVTVNGPPKITSAALTTASENQAYSYPVVASDPDPNETLTFDLPAAPNGMSIGDNSGLIDWTPASTQIGDHAVAVRVTDSGGLTDTQTFTVTVAKVVSPPEITPIPDQIMNEGATLTIPVTAVAPAGNSLVLSASGLHPFMSFTDAGDGTGSFTFNPGFANAGSYSLSVAAGDGNLSSLMNFTLLVNNVNRPPGFTSTPVTVANADKPYSYQLEATDPDLATGDVLTFTLEMHPIGMTIGDTSGLIEWTPVATDIKDHDVTARVTDAGGLSATQHFTIAVSPPNTAPTALTTAVNTSEDTAVTIVLTGSDVDQDPLTCAIETPPTQGSLGPIRQCVVPPPGLVSWWPGDSTADDIQDGNHGSLQDNATFAPGRVGDGFSFDGISDHVFIGNPANLHLQNFTIDAWIKRTSTSQTTRDPGVGIEGDIVAYGFGGYGFILHPDGRLILTKVGVNHVSSNTLKVTDTNWHHVAVTKSGSTVTFYVDGIAEDPIQYDPGFTFSTNAAIGVRGDDLKQSFWGLIDEVEIYNRALAADEIIALLNAGQFGKCRPSRCIAPPGRSCQLVVR